MDPTMGMLIRLLKASGRHLLLTWGESLPRDSLTLANLINAWSRTLLGDRPDWTRLRALLDGIARQPGRTRFVIGPTPQPSGSPVMDALLAAIADKLADDHGLKRPAWTKEESRFLECPWESPGTPRMRQLAREQTPGQLLAHGIVASWDSLWRDPTSLGTGTSV